MPDSKITALTALTAADPANDMFPIVDVSDTSMAASGTTKRISINNLLAASGTATLASATITGDLTVRTNKLFVNATGVGVGTTNILSDFVVQNGSNSRFEIASQAGGIVIENFNNARNAYLNMTMYADAYIWNRLGTTAMTLNSTGLGIGVTPSAWTTYKALQISNGSIANYSPTQDLRISSNAYYASGVWKRISAAFASQYLLDGSSGIHAWYVAATGAADSTITTFANAAMTLDASGNLLLNATSFAVNNGKLRIQHSGLAGEWGFQTKSSATDGYVGVFYTTTGQAGFISVSGTSATFSTTSDYRLKENVQPIVGGLARINTLKPSTYKWKADGSNSEGFIAHELAEVVPAAVTGQKDAVNADGSIKPQGVDLSKLVPILVAAIQELTARVQTLEAK